jgi:hypothetical protein
LNCGKLSDGVEADRWFLVGEGLEDGLHLIRVKITGLRHADRPPELRVAELEEQRWLWEFSLMSDHPGHLGQMAVDRHNRA